MEELPTDYLRGLDFNIKKTSKGGYADYSTSNWARRESPLTEAEQAAIEAHGLYNLSEFLPKKPSEAELRVIKAMFEASVDGQSYDTERWGQYYKPFGLDVGPAKTTESAPATSAPAQGYVAPNTGATASAPVIRAQYSSATAIQYLANYWIVAGDIV